MPRRKPRDPTAGLIITTGQGVLDVFHMMQVLVVTEGVLQTRMAEAREVGLDPSDLEYRLATRDSAGGVLTDDLHACCARALASSGALADLEAVARSMVITGWWFGRPIPEIAAIMPTGIYPIPAELRGVIEADQRERDQRTGGTR